MNLLMIETLAWQRLKPPGACIFGFFRPRLPRPPRTSGKGRRDRRRRADYFAATGRMEMAKPPPLAACRLSVVLLVTVFFVMV